MWSWSTKPESTIGHDPNKVQAEWDALVNNPKNKKTAPFAKNETKQKAEASIEKSAQENALLNNNNSDVAENSNNASNIENIEWLTSLNTPDITHITLDILEKIHRGAGKKPSDDRIKKYIESSLATLKLPTDVKDKAKLYENLLTKALRLEESLNGKIPAYLETTLVTLRNELYKLYNAQGLATDEDGLIFKWKESEALAEISKAASKDIIEIEWLTSLITHDNSSITLNILKKIEYEVEQLNNSIIAWLGFNNPDNHARNLIKKSLDELNKKIKSDDHAKLYKKLLKKILRTKQASREDFPSSLESIFVILRDELYSRYYAAKEEFKDENGVKPKTKKTLKEIEQRLQDTCIDIVSNPFKIGIRSLTQYDTTWLETLLEKHNLKTPNLEKSNRAISEFADLIEAEVTRHISLLAYDPAKDTEEIKTLHEDIARELFHTIIQSEYFAGLFKSLNKYRKLLKVIEECYITTDKSNVKLKTAYDTLLNELLLRLYCLENDNLSIEELENLRTQKMRQLFFSELARTPMPDFNNDNSENNSRWSNVRPLTMVSSARNTIVGLSSSLFSYVRTVPANAETGSQASNNNHSAEDESKKIAEFQLSKTLWEKIKKEFDQSTRWSTYASSFLLTDLSYQTRTKIEAVAKDEESDELDKNSLRFVIAQEFVSKHSTEPLAKIFMKYGIQLVENDPDNNNNSKPNPSALFSHTNAPDTDAPEPAPSMENRS